MTAVSGLLLMVHDREKLQQIARTSAAEDRCENLHLQWIALMSFKVNQGHLNWR